MPYIGPVETAKAVLEVGDRIWDPVIMVAIAGAESGWDTTAVSPTQDYGLFQINLNVWSWLFAIYDWSNAYQNTRMAFEVWRRQGYAAWVAYQVGAYQRFLQAARDAVAQVEQRPPSIQPIGDLLGSWTNIHKVMNEVFPYLFYKLGDAINIYRAPLG